MTEIQSLFIDKSRLDKASWSSQRTPELSDGQVLCQIHNFALTANNISYADHGEKLGYWQFFPASAGQGVLPVWGFASVVKSTTGDVAEGERLFGFFPMASHLLMSPGRNNAQIVEDTIDHRQALPRVYNQYFRTAADPLYQARFEAQQALYKPLFITAFVADDFLADEQFFGAKQVLISSASSKTAMAIAHLLGARAEVSCIGLTSSGNVDFTRGLGCYDRVVAYDKVAELAGDVPSVYVDIAGNGQLRDQVHEQYNAQLRHSCSIGGSHWQARSDQPPAMGPKPRFLFAPSHVEKRVAQWGAAKFSEAVALAWQGFLPLAIQAVEVTPRIGPDAMAETYQDLLRGKNDPRHGYMASWS
ncbi:MAG: DUF2855 family protein [Lysobacterales bacterium]